MTDVVAARVTKRWKRTRGRDLGIDGVSFRAVSGEIVGVVGPNGAGKSTLLRLLSGVARLTSGSLTIGGCRAGTRAARRAVGYAADPPRMPPELSGLEWLHYLSTHRADSRSHRLRLVQWAVELVDGETFVDRRIRTYSRGMAQRVAFAAAAIAGTSVITLDETLSGMDPIIHRKLRGRVRELGNGGRTIFIASHDLATVETMATRVLVLVAGRLAADVSTAALLDRRVAVLTMTGESARGAERLLSRYPHGERTDLGVAIPLRKGLSMEHVLAACREERLPIAHTRTRYETLEDILLRAMSGQQER